MHPQVPDRPHWIHEIKFDGHRLIVQRGGKGMRLFTPKAATGAIESRRRGRRYGIGTALL